MNQEIVILFDDCCNLCNGVVQFVIKTDKRKNFKFAAMQSESGQALLKRSDLPTENFNSFVLIIGCRYYIKSRAGLLVFKELGGYWKLLYIFILIPRPLRDLVYDIIARNRYLIFGRREQCMVPTAETKDRFLV